METNFTLVYIDMIKIKTYVNNEEVQPAPSVGEIDLETVCNPF